VNITVEPITSFNTVREAALITVHRRDVENKPITKKLAEHYFLSEHSPIRSFIIRITMHDVSRRVAMHLVRHVHSLPFVSSTRPDRFPERASDEIVDMIQDFNAQALIDMARKRLCHMSYKDTIKTVKAVKKALLSYKGSDETVIQTLGFFMVPNCVYRGGCPEQRSCGLYKNLVKNYNIDTCETILERYSVYNNEYIWEED